MVMTRTGQAVSRLACFRSVAVALAAAVFFTGGGLLAATPAAAATLDELAGSPAAADLDVMTFNLRYASSSRPNSWAQRRPAMRELLTAEQPDLIGTQEGLAGQLANIKQDLGSRYELIGVGREGGTRGEYMAIFYDNTRLQPLEQHHFWLSDTPEVVGSNTWGGGSIRMVTWVRFRDVVTGGQLYAVNTHLDNASALARERAAQLIRARLAALAPGLPIVLTGDFNSGPWAGSPVYDVLVRQAGLVDTWTAAAATGPAYGTYHNYQPLVAGGARIDWILATRGVTVSAAAINTYGSGSGQFPSDHLPVQARLRLPVATTSEVTLVNRATGKCLDVYASSLVDGADAGLWTCNGGANQRWRIDEAAGGNYRLINLASSKALDVNGCGTADGTKIQQWSWLNNACQRWSLIDTEDGWMRLENVNSGKVADVADCGTTDGTTVRLWAWLNNYCQQWQARS
ncbi:hypothetical protein MCAG_02657 [Micromonospora sp. ATCC 39149]|nr:hypothetical protein MCAG_02657 [Micromonospora sp. ATCC 39149]